jgi:hypothetical protein
MRTTKQSHDIAELSDEVRRAVAEALASMLANAGKEVERGSRTYKEFCERHDLSPSQLFKLFREGRGPRVMLIGSAGKRISAQAEDDWVKAREAEAAAEAAIAEPEASQ